MRIGWLVGLPGYVGGAELTQAEFRRAAPGGVETIDCPPGGVVPGLDKYVAHNVFPYGLADLEALEGADVVKYQHDQWPEGDPEVRGWFLANARMVFCSPLHRECFTWPHADEGACIPPAADYTGAKPPRQARRNTKRNGLCSIAQWRNPGKGAQLVEEWARENGPVDVYGPGPFEPKGPGVNYRGELHPDMVAQTLWAYEQFVFLPLELEPFCRTVAEAYFAGCRVVTNELIGARYYLENDPAALTSAANDFWSVVCPT